MDGAARLCHRGLHGTVLAEAYLAQGDVSHADRLITEALATCRAAEYRLGVGWAQRAGSRLAHLRGDSASAGALLIRALRTFSDLDARLEVGRRS